MNVFEAVKQNVTTRQAAELYGVRVGRNGMAVCPFHNDKNPSMKVDKRFHCFACQADGDTVDFVSRLFGLPSKEAAMKIADDFGISYDSRQKPSIRPKIREPTPEQKYQQEENHCYKVLSDYFHLLRKWEKQYAPQRTDDVWHPLFVEALQRKSHVEYQLDILLYSVFSVVLSHTYTNPHAAASNHLVRIQLLILPVGAGYRSAIRPCI